MTAQTINVQGEEASVKFKKIHSVVESLKQFTQRLISCAVQHYHHVDGTYQLEAGMVRESCKSLKHASAKVSITQAKQVGLNGDKVLINS